MPTPSSCMSMSTLHIEIYYLRNVQIQYLIEKRHCMDYN